MGLYRYVAKNSMGQNVSATIEADNEVNVITQLKRRGLTILSIDEDFTARKTIRKRKKKVKLNEVVVFSRQLATMVDAGLPLIQSLETLREQIENPTFNEIVDDLVGNIERGSSFSEALSAHPKVFSSLFVNMVKAGEASGTLSEILDRIASYLESTAALKRKIKSAMIYPAIITTMAIIITLVLLIKVIPVFKGIYESFGSQLPLPTRMLLTISDLLRKWFFIVAGLVGAGIFFLFRYKKTENGAYRFDRFKLRLPVFGELFKKISVSRFTRTLGVLVRSGVPILSALDIVSRTAGNKLVEKAVSHAIEEIKRGENIAEPLRASEVFPPMVTRMISVGERSGKLELMLEKISDFYDDQVNAMVSGLTALIEPMLIAFLGIVIGGIVICMFLPIFRLSTIVTK